MTSRINAAWHRQHRMPRNATLAQRMAWHIEHHAQCNCRPIPQKLLAQMNARQSTPPTAARSAARSGEFYLVAPPRRRGPGVLVLHSWWGLTGAVRGICDRLAKEGFVAVAPDLYGGRVARTASEAKKLRSAPRREPMWKTISHAIETLRSHKAVVGRRLGALGLSMGGHWALWFASRPESPITATVVFYAARASAFEKGPDSAFQIHFADTDEFVSTAAARRMQQALERAGRRTDVFAYPGTRHWFFEADRPEYDPQAASLAWKRTLAFLRAQLGATT